MRAVHARSLRVAAEHGIVIGIQNHDDIGAHYLSLADLIDEIDRPNCKACFDAGRSRCT